MLITTSCRKISEPLQPLHAQLAGAVEQKNANPRMKEDMVNKIAQEAKETLATQMTAAVSEPLPTAAATQNSPSHEPGAGANPTGNKVTLAPIPEKAAPIGIHCLIGFINRLFFHKRNYRARN